MSLLDGMRYECIVCRRSINQGMMTKSGDPPMKCRGCKGWICPACLVQDREAGITDCPECGGDLYYPLFNI
ncbi:MAG: hypothetical protein ACMUIG_02010 [Thermoplasmatota archaeon]